MKWRNTIINVRKIHKYYKKSYNLSKNGMLMEKGDHMGRMKWLGNRINQAVGALLLLSFLWMSAGGCGIERTDGQKLEDLPYAILEEKEIPQELLKAMEEKKETGFKLTYEDKEYLYIAIGYGAQETGGYSISINECYRTKNAVYFGTTLIGPRKGEKINEVASYPYIAIRTKYLKKNVVFQ